jgi:hypothetical protein
MASLHAFHLRAHHAHDHLASAVTIEPETPMATVRAKRTSPCAKLPWPSSHLMYSDSLLSIRMVSSQPTNKHRSATIVTDHHTPDVRWGG